MSCLNLDGKICKIHGLICDIPPCNCKDYEGEHGLKSNMDWSTITPEPNNKTMGDVKMNEGQPYCKYCFNARIYKPTEEELMDPFSTELTDENDFSSCSVGHCFSRNRRFMIDSGNGHPVKIVFEEWTEAMPEWHRVGVYYPKYCPECGRILKEYDNKVN